MRVVFVISSRRGCVDGRRADGQESRHKSGPGAISRDQLLSLTPRRRDGHATRHDRGIRTRARARGGRHRWCDGDSPAVGSVDAHRRIRLLLIWRAGWTVPFLIQQGRLRGHRGRTGARRHFRCPYATQRPDRGRRTALHFLARTQRHGLRHRRHPLPALPDDQDREPDVRDDYRYPAVDGAGESAHLVAGRLYRCGRSCARARDRPSGPRRRDDHLRRDCAAGQRW